MGHHVHGRIARSYTCLKFLGRAVTSLLRDPVRIKPRSRCHKNILRRRLSKFFDARRYQLTRRQAEKVLAECQRKPLVSIVVPVYKTPSKWLRKCAGSVLAQQYGNWELILVDDGSGMPRLTRALEALASRDDRVRVNRLERNVGISEATNAGIEMASGEFVGLLDHDDELTPDALTWSVWALNENPDAVWIYSDEDKISPRGVPHLAHFKPDFNPLLLLSTMYTCHFSVYQTSLLRWVGGLRKGFDGSQDHDLALRLSEIVDREQVVHVPRVLYHWRAIPASAAESLDAKPYAAIAGRNAVAEALKRRKLKGEVSSHFVNATTYRIELRPQNYGKVSILIPTRDACDMVKTCIRALREHTEYPDYEVIVVDSQSTEPELHEYLGREESAGRLRTIRYDEPFNHSRMNNIAAEQTDSDYIVLLNNNVEITSDAWLEQMVATAEIDPMIAGVGALLVYPDGLVQHSGLILGIYGVAGRAHHGMHKTLTGYFGRLHCVQEVSAVTGAMALLRRSAFLSVGGFDAERYPTTFNDLDLWIRLRKAGFRCVYDPVVEAIHRECKTRKLDPRQHQEDIIRFRSDWGEFVENDPFYNPNLPLDNEQFCGVRDFPVEAQLRALRAG